MDFDPRDYCDERDPRDRDRDERDRDRDDARWPDRDRDPRDRATDPRDVFTRGLRLPRGVAHELAALAGVAVGGRPRRLG